jgi:DNA-binding XRE family transcriptional regulator
MSYGYTARLIVLNKQANISSLGVRLGRICVKHDVPVSTVAGALGVSRQTVYNWFTGGVRPKLAMEPRIRTQIKKYDH